MTDTPAAHDHPGPDDGDGDPAHASHEHRHQPRSFEDELADFRTRKDAFFRFSDGSPIPHAQRHDFAGLRYFPPSLEHRLEGLRLTPEADPDATADIVTSDGKTRTAWRVGTLTFELPGGHGRLAAYTFGDPAESDGNLFIPFRDATSGRETYGAGRYLDLEPDADGTYTLDFNVAYNPWCAYAAQYSCPLPPPENWLAFRVEAGEQSPDLPEADPPASPA